MNGMGLIASLVSSLAWPTAVVIILAIFRRPIAKLIGRATQYKGFGQEITFGDELADVESKVQKFWSYMEAHFSEAHKLTANKSVAGPQRIPELTQPSAWAREPKRIEGEEIPPEPSYAELNQLVQIAQNFPSQAILDAWEWLRNVAANTLPDKSNLDRMEEKGWRMHWIVPAQISGAVSELNDLRDKVAHGRHTPTPGEAIAYVQTCEQMARAIYRAFPHGFISGWQIAQQSGVDEQEG
jgi:hypothetical protein